MKETANVAHNFFLRKTVNHGAECWILHEAQKSGWKKTKVGGLKGWRLSVALPYIRKALDASRKQKEFKSQSPTVNASSKILEEDGVRLALAFLGLRNLQKLERAEKLCQEVSAMSREEAYYWYSKVSAGLGIKALRVLFCV